MLCERKMTREVLESRKSEECAVHVLKFRVKIAV